jgi:hypothetical protein
MAEFLDEQALIEKLRKIEALYAGAKTPGESAAAASALERIKSRLRDCARTSPPEEFRFTFADQWSQMLFIALLRRYGIDPYRYRGQRHTTVMARVSRQVLDDTLYPEYTDLRQTLEAHLMAVTQRIIARAIHPDFSDTDERSGGRRSADD